MSTMSTTGLYEEDLHGTNPANLVTDDVQTLQVPGPDDYYFIIPKAAPYFADSLKVYNHQTGQLYVENEDYLVGHYFIEAMESIGRPICGSIRFMKRTIQGQVRLEYRTIGGQWGFSDQAILAELSNRQLNPLIRSWAQIDVLPALFPPLEHNQPVNSLVGSKEILAALENLAAVIEAAAEGASQSHLTDFSNPHKVTATQVQLGNVPNFTMATDTEATEGTRSDLFISPRGVNLQIQTKALVPLNNHINSRGNVHGLVASDINLGNVPNYPAATPTTALDITNDAAIMTPYTTALLVEKLSNLGRIDDLENLIKTHIADTNNPHKLTPAILGMYSNKEIDDKLAAISGGGGDATTFGGKTPSEWEEGFVSVTQAETIIDAVKTAKEQGITEVTNAVVASDYTAADETLYQRTLVTMAVAGYSAYSVTNANFDVRIISASDSPVLPDVLYNGTDSWASVRNATYVIEPNGAIASFGTEQLTAPPGWKDDVSFIPANACEAVFPTRNRVYIRKKSTQSAPTDPLVYNDTYVYTASGAPTVAYPASNPMVSLVTTGQLKYVGETTIVERRPPAASDSVYEGAGDAAWVTAVNAAIANVKTQLGAGETIREARVGNEYVLFAGSLLGRVFVYKINRTGNTVNSVTRVPDATAEAQMGKTGILANSVRITGAHDHFGILTTDGRAVFFGDNTDGQCEVDQGAGPFLAVAAGHNYTVTVNQMHQTLFWGNSPDNSMLYGQRGISIHS